MKLTVIIRNDGPLVFCNDTPSYRSVQIELTEEQRNILKMRNVGIDCGHDVFEQISHCFIEEKETSL